MPHVRITKALCTKKIRKDVADTREKFEQLLPDKLKLAAASKNYHYSKLAEDIDISEISLYHYTNTGSHFRVPSIDNFLKLDKFFKALSFGSLYNDFSSYELALLNLLTDEEKNDMMYEISRLMYLTGYSVQKVYKETGIQRNLLYMILRDNDMPMSHSYVLYYLLHFLQEKPFCEFAEDLRTNGYKKFFLGY